jgi:protease I
MTRDVAILVEDDYEDLELWYPYYRLKEAGWNPVIVGPGTKESYRSKHGYEAKVDLDALRADPRSFVALVVPGGFAPDRLRRHHVVTELVKKVFDSGKVVAAICHGPSVLISANVLRGRKATCFFSIRDDVINAGAMYFDEEVVVDRNLITSRTPADLPAFMREVLNALG